MTDLERLNKFLAEQRYMTIAVTLDDGKPWAVPVRIKRWDAKLFEWDSLTDTEHSKAIVTRSDVAVSIFTPEGEGTTQFGFYGHATAEQISEPNDHGVATYRAVVNTCFINDASFVKREVHDL